MSPKTLLSAAAVGLALWWPLAGTRARRQAPDWSRPRELPSLVTRWESAGESCGLALRDGVAFVLRKDGVGAFAARSGRALWQTRVAEGDCPYHWQRPLLVWDKRVVWGLRDRLLVLERGTGRLERTIALEGYLSHIAGPPLAVVIGKQDRSYELQSLDLESGRVRARRALPGSVSSLAAASGVILTSWSVEREYTTVGLKPGDLSELWRSAVFQGLREQDGVVYATAPDESCGCDERFAALDPQDGLPVERLPARGETGNNSTAGAGLPWDLQLVAPQDPYFRLRRNRRTDGKPMWTAALPGSLGASVRDGDTLFVHVEPGGRGLLLALDFRTGRVERAAYGRRDVYEMAAQGDVLLLHARDAVVAVASREVGPPESASRPVRDEVKGIMAREPDYWDLAASGRELSVLGPEALPVLAELVPTLEPLRLQLAAQVFAQAEYRPAAPLLAARLPGLADDPMPYASTTSALLHALAAIGGPPEVAAAARILAKPAERSDVRLAAFTALVSLGTPEAVTAIDAALAARPAPGPWWRPPEPTPLLARLDRPISAEDVQRRRERATSEPRPEQAYAEVAALAQARSSARVRLAGGRTLLVFPDGWLGNFSELWAVTLDAASRPEGKALFLGVRAPGEHSYDGMPIAARVEGSRLTIESRARKAAAVVVNLEEVGRDSDGDGIPDGVEKRLFLDPNRVDSDGDGIKDPDDPVPNAAKDKAESEEREIERAFFEQHFLFSGTQPGAPLLIVSDHALGSYGRAGPMLVLSPKETERLAAQAEAQGLGLPTRLSFEPAAKPSKPSRAMPLAAWTSRAGPRARPVAAERAFSFVTYTGPLNAAGYEVVMRKLGGRWYIRAFNQRWVS